MHHCLDVAAAREWMLIQADRATLEFLPDLALELSALTDEAMDARNRISVLEELRPAIWRRLAEFERDQLGRAMPFNEAETARWQSYIEAWSHLLAAYMRSLADADNGEPGVVGLAPLLMQRVVRQAVQLAIASYRAYQPLERDLWTLIHEQLRRAEKAGLLDVSVADPTLSMDARGTLAEACLHLLLLDFSDPYAMPPAQLALASQWMERLARLARFSLESVPHGQAGFLVLKLDEPQGLRLVASAPDPADPRSGAPRFVDISAANEQVKRLLAKIHLGIPPSDLYLGEHCTRDEAEALLMRLHRRWRATRRRSHPRRATKEPAKVALGLQAIHRYLVQMTLGDLPLVTAPWHRLPDVDDGDSPAQTNESADGPGNSDTTPLLALSESQIVDQSPSGIGLLQSADHPVRLRLHQLLALTGSRELLLGSVRWLSIDPQAGLRFGVRLIAGRPSPVRLVASSTESGSYERALLLPAMPSLDQVECLVIPVGVYWPARPLKLWTEAGVGGARDVALGERLECGADFERVSFTFVR